MNRKPRIHQCGKLLVLIALLWLPLTASSGQSLSDLSGLAETRTQSVANDDKPSPETPTETLTETVTAPVESVTAPAMVPSTETRSELDVSLSKKSVVIGTIGTLLEETTLADSTLAKAKTDLLKVRQELAALKTSAEDQRARAETQLKALAGGTSTLPAAEAVVTETTRLNKQGGNLLISLSEIARLEENTALHLQNIGSYRSRLFKEQLFERRRINADLVIEAEESLPAEISRFKFIVSSWFKNLRQNRFRDLVTALILSLSFAVFIISATKMWIYPILARARVTELQPYLRRVFSTLWTGFIPSLAAGLSLLALFWIFKIMGLLNPKIELMFRACLIAIFILVFVFHLAHALLAPKRSNWRLFRISDHAALRLTFLVMGIAATYCLAYLLAEIRGAISSSVALTVLTSFTASLIICVLSALVLLTRLTPKTEASRFRILGWSPWIYLPAWLALLFVLGAAIAGYTSFADFLASQLVVTVPILIAIYIGLLSAKAIGTSGALVESSIGQSLIGNMNFNEKSVDQIGLFSAPVIAIGTLLLGIPFAMLQWGFQQTDVLSWMTSLFTGFSIGSFNVSLTRFFAAFLALTIGIVLTRIFQRWLNSNVLQRTNMDSGAQNSVSSGIGYVGYFIAALVALRYSGIDLSKLALIAGALSVGIGFGLQNVVNNFVSGIILLVERPIRVGDWIIVGSNEGYVRNISVRATQLETFDRRSIIIPNSELINASVGNWMLKNKTGRLIIPVGVSYDADEEQVRSILFGLVENEKRLLKTPAPFINFKDFGDNALIFEVRVFLKDVAEIVTVGSDLRFAIRKALKEADISIPFPQRDVHIITDKKEL